ncbi:Sorting nexin MVP1 [Dissostichus eleginoides]|uniref:Sorting nexin MVP1 n=1 Tax=Dissostichus eleginoides TaxID=100907 RepID=A0AAD9F2M1_DISEL|nr:Sorting nexin MVP1 [Dissostichus eleginoides]
MSYDPDGGDAKGSTQHALARIVGIGERIGGPVPNSAEKRRNGSCFGAQCATCSGPLQQDCELITQQRGLQDAGVSAPVLRGASMLQLSPA